MRGRAMKMKLEDSAVAETSSSITESQVTKTSSSIFQDLKLLVKGIVLVLNILPIFTGYILALYFTNTTLQSLWVNFLCTMIGGTFIMAGALILNNWYEVDLDKKMVRTQERPTVTGSMDLKNILKLGLFFSLIGFVILSFTTLEAFLYGLIGWFFYVVLYTFWSKRRYTLNTIIGSVSGAVTPLIGWAAVDSSFHIVPLMMFLLLFFWQIPHTFAIAIRRFDDYKNANVPMLPVVSGIEITKRQMFIYTLCLLPIPFYLTSLGTIFVVIATILNIGFIIVSIKGFTAKDDKKWANSMFKTSLIYLTVFLLSMLATTMN